MPSSVTRIGSHIPTALTIPHSPIFRSNEDLLLAPPASLLEAGSSALDGQRHPNIHLLIPASETNVNLCKTLISAFLLRYPPPTLINYGKFFDATSWDKGSHTGKIRGVLDYLSGNSQVRDDDLVLIIDGYDVWFQLPPELLVARYHRLVQNAGKRLRKDYGTITRMKSQGAGESEIVPKYNQTIIFGADKICWPNAAEDPACAALPPSTLPANIFGPSTDKDPESFHNRPRYLNSGAVIGLAAVIRSLYERATQKVEEQDRGAIGDQFVFAEIFGEQEYQRELTRKSSQGPGGRWWNRLPGALGSSAGPFAGDQKINNMTVVTGQRYEFSIGLDYESSLFQTMAHSGKDIEFIRYNDSALLKNIQEQYQPYAVRLSGLPFDLQQTRNPAPYATQTPPPNRIAKSIFYPFSADLDILSENLTWSNIPLATNIYAASIPSLLHLNGDKSRLSTWWQSMWFFQNSRALLRHYMRSPQSLDAASAAAVGGPTWWDMRGGKGGVWTDQGNWMDWSEVCQNTEDEIFMDGKGTWGREDDSWQIIDAWGRSIIGEQKKKRNMENDRKVA